MINIEQCKYCTYNKKDRDNPKRCYKYHVSEGELSLCKDWFISDEDRLEMVKTLVKSYNETFMADPWNTMSKISIIVGAE